MPDKAFYWPGGIEWGMINPWNILKVMGSTGGGWITVPGITDVKPTSTQKLDKKRSAGKNFSTLTTEGLEPCDLIITTRIWTPNQWVIWQLNVWPIIRPLPGTSADKHPKLIWISHPASNFHDIQGITVETIEGPHR